MSQKIEHIDLKALNMDSTKVTNEKGYGVELPYVSSAEQKAEFLAIKINELIDYINSMSPSPKDKERKEITRYCQVSPLYGKDEMKDLHFYCDYCNKEMDYEEKRVCEGDIVNCKKCGSRLGNSDYSVSTCLSCHYKI